MLYAISFKFLEFILFYILGVFFAFFIAKDVIGDENEKNRKLNIICAIISLFSWLFIVFIIFCFIIMIFSPKNEKD